MNREELDELIEKRTKIVEPLITSPEADRKFAFRIGMFEMHDLLMCWHHIEDEKPPMNKQVIGRLENGTVVLITRCIHPRGMEYYKGINYKMAEMLEWWIDVPYFEY